MCDDYTDINDDDGEKEERKRRGGLQRDLGCSNRTQKTAAAPCSFPIHLCSHGIVQVQVVLVRKRSTQWRNVNYRITWTAVEDLICGKEIGDIPTQNENCADNIRAFDYRLKQTRYQSSKDNHFGAMLRMDVVAKRIVQYQAREIHRGRCP